jgi:hypothetical protein
MARSGEIGRIGAEALRRLEEGGLIKRVEEGSGREPDWSVELRAKHVGNLGTERAEEMLDSLAAYFPVVSLSPSEASFRLTIPAESAQVAIAKAIDLLGPAAYIAVSAMTVDELEREIEQPSIPDLIGAAEIGDMAGVSRQRADQWADLSDFPPPAVTTRAGRLWLRASVNRWLERTPRRAGRPKTAQPA